MFELYIISDLDKTSSTLMKSFDTAVEAVTYNMKHHSDEQTCIIWYDVNKKINSISY